MEIKSAKFIKGINGTDPILDEPKMQVAFVGRSNVGKSSLMNKLLNRRDLVKAGKKPGKTQEINFFLVNDDFYFVDLPGYGFAKMPIKDREHLSKLIQWYLILTEVPNRKIVLVLDCKVGPNEMDLEMLRLLEEKNREVLVAVNKIDSLNQKELSESLKMIKEKLPGHEILLVSAKTGDGTDMVWNWINENRL